MKQEWIHVISTHIKIERAVIDRDRRRRREPSSRFEIRIIKPGRLRRSVARRFAVVRVKEVS